MTRGSGVVKPGVSLRQWWWAVGFAVSFRGSAVKVEPLRDATISRGGPTSLWAYWCWGYERGVGGSALNFRLLDATPSQVRDVGFEART